MLKRVLIIILITLTLMKIGNIAFADESNINVLIDNRQIKFNTQPFISNNRILVPFRAILEALGATVEWDSNTKTVTTRKDDSIVIIQIGSRTAIVNGKNVTVEVPAIIVNERTFVPLRFISESFGSEVIWDGVTRTVSINSIRKNSILKNVLQNNSMSLIDNRVLIKMPEGSKDEAIQQSIMSAKSSSHIETRIILEGGGQKLVVYAREMFAYSTDDSFENDAKKILESWTKQNEIGYSILPTKSKKDIKIIEVIPENYTANNNTIFVRGAIVKNPDNTLIFINIYVTTETFIDKNDCISLAKNIINSIESGSRRINASAREETIEGNIKINLEKDYVLINQEGPDFTVHNIVKIVPVGVIQPYMGIYFGRHPSFTYQKHGLSEDEIKHIAGTIFNVDIEWLYYNPDINIVNSDSFMETMLYFEDSLWKIHIFIYPTNENDLQEMKKIAQSLEFIE